MQVRNLREPGRYGDGNGLYLVVDPSGAKRWLLRVVVQGKRRDIGLGGTSLVTLAEAREKAIAFRKIAREGGDPLAARLKAVVVVVPTFAEAAEQVYADHKATWRNEKHAAQWITTLRTYAVPFIGTKRIDQIDTPDILKVLSPIWLTKPETARRVRQRLGTIFDWAKTAGHRSGDNPVEGVARGLPKQSGAEKHHAALPFAEVPSFVANLRGNETGLVTRLAFEFLILTAARTSEVLEAEWQEIDGTAKVWTVPAARMKAGRVHRVPLGERTLAILEQAKPLAMGSRYLFPGRDGERPLSNTVFLMMLRRMKIAITAHGFRSSFRDWAAETTSFPREVVEMALAHTVENKVEAAYRRGDLLDKRRELMGAWETYASQGGTSTTRHKGNQPNGSDVEGVAQL